MFLSQIKWLQTCVTWDGLLQCDGGPLHLPGLHSPLHLHSRLESQYEECACCLHHVLHHGLHQGGVGPVHHRHRLARGYEQVGWLALALEHLQGRDGVGLGHGVDQGVVADLQLDLLESPGHGGAGPRPVAVDVHDGEAALREERCEALLHTLTLYSGKLGGHGWGLHTTWPPWDHHCADTCLWQSSLQSCSDWTLDTDTLATVFLDISVVNQNRKKWEMSFTVLLLFLLRCRLSVSVTGRHLKSKTDTWNIWLLVTLSTLFVRQ